MNRKIFRVLFFTIFAAMLGQGLVVPLLPAYAHDLGASSLYIGFVFGVFCVSRTLFLPVFGRLSDKKGRKPFIVFGLFAYFMASVAFMFSNAVAALIAIRFLQGIAAAMVMPVAQAYAGEITPPGREGYVMGLLNAFLCAGLSIGPIMGGAMKDAFGMGAAFLSMGFFCFAGFLLCLICLPPTKTERISARKSAHAGWACFITDRRVAGIFLYRMAHSVCIGAVWSFAPLLAEVRFELSGLSIGLMITSGVVFSALLMVPMGVLADKMGKRPLIVAGGLVVVAGMFMFAYLREPWEFYAVSVVLGIGGGMALPAVMAVAVVIGGEKSAMGTVVSILTVAESLGMVIGPVLGGLAMDVFGATTAFSGCAILMLSATISVMFFTSDSPAPEDVGNPEKIATEV